MNDPEGADDATKASGEADSTASSQSDPTSTSPSSPQTPPAPPSAVPPPPPPPAPPAAAPAPALPVPPAAPTPPPPPAVGALPPLPMPPPPSQVAYPTGPPPQNGFGTAALILGIVSVLPCAYFIPLLGYLFVAAPVLAIIFGVIGRKKADQGLATNKNLATWGFWLGIAGLVLYVIAVVVLIAWFAAAGN